MALHRTLVFTKFVTKHPLRRPLTKQFIATSPSSSKMAASTTQKAIEGFFKDMKSHVADERWEDKAIKSAKAMPGIPAKFMLQQMGFDSRREPFKLLDHACGTGLVAGMIQESVNPGLLAKSSILCADFSPQMVDLVKSRMSREGWVNCEARVLDAQETDLADSSFSHVTANLGFHIIPDPDKAMKECIRVLQPGGLLALTVPHKSNVSMQDIADAFASFPFNAPIPNPWPNQVHSSGHWVDHNWLRRKLTVVHGLEDVDVQVQVGLVPMASSDAFIEMAGPMIGMFMGAYWPAETREAHSKEEVVGLVRKFVEERYEGGAWSLPFTVVVATGRKPMQA